ncbi:hypothetical protein IJU97_06410 [bacterium]|nr:hypothetical protein [bacterium]
MRIAENEIFFNCCTLDDIPNFLNKVSKEHGGCIVWTTYNGTLVASTMSLETILARRGNQCDRRTPETIEKENERIVASKKRLEEKKQEIAALLAPKAKEHYENWGKVFYSKHGSNLCFDKSHSWLEAWNLAVDFILKRFIIPNDVLSEIIKGGWNNQRAIECYDGKYPELEDVITMMQFANTRGVTEKMLHEKAWSLARCVSGVLELRRLCTLLSKKALPNGKNAAKSFFDALAS